MTTIRTINALLDLREECCRAIKSHCPSCEPWKCESCADACDLQEIGKVLYEIERSEM
jgi:hypothetical protein